MKKAFFIMALLSVPFLQAAEIVEVRIKIPMNNDEARIKDYYLSTDGVRLKKDLVIKIIRTVAISSAGKKNLGELKIEIGQLRIMAINDKVAVAREYKIHSNENAPLTESIGFMIGDHVDTADSFIDKNPRKTSSEETTASREVASATIAIAPATSAVPAAPTAEPAHKDGEAHPDADKIKVKIFPEAI